ncbi:serine hydrolase domain-containing protein [Propionicimonas sp.]|uniref:serine hydrolase domain-containing protein n=1 Tax=Propionicimonas sp. TaxID=1955623 RepID=UPI0039E66B06
MLRDGECVLEQYWEPWVGSDRPLVYSASKTFAATAVGLAIGEGRFDLDDHVVDLVPLAGADDVDVDVAAITVHHLLSMSTGHTEDTLPAMTQRPPQEWARAFGSIRPERPPGSCHVYNNGASFMLGELVRRHTGADLLDYLRPRLLAPLGIDATWDRDPMGRCLGWSGLHVDVRGLAALGELLRCDGVWRGRRLLPDGWVARATARQIATISDGPEWTYGYGYQVWMGREGFRLDGAFGQFAFVLPERGMVLAVQSAQADTQCLIDTVWEHLGAVPDEPTGPRPGVPSLPGQPGSDERAPRRVAVAFPHDSGLGTGWAAAGPVPSDPALFPAGEEVGPPARIADPVASRTTEGFRLRMVAEGRPVELTAVTGGWLRQSVALTGERGAEESLPSPGAVPVAVAAGVDATGDLRVHLAFTDTPHTLRLRLGADGTAGQGWTVNPLQGPSLANMRAR